MKVKNIETGEEIQAEKLEDGTYKVGEETLTAEDMKIRFIKVVDKPAKKSDAFAEYEPDEIIVTGTEEGVGKLFEALAEAQGEFEIGKKDKAGHGYKYMPLQQVIEIGKKALSDNKLSLSQFPSTFQRNGKRFAMVTSILGHSHGAYVKSSFVVEVEPNKRNSLVQTIGSQITYLARYGRTNILGIAADEDKDGADEL